MCHFLQTAFRTNLFLMERRLMMRIKTSEGKQLILVEFFVWDFVLDILNKDWKLTERK